jgi:hypothetical protein
MRILLLRGHKAPNKSNFWPNSTRKKQFRNTNKQANKTPRSIKDKMLKIRRPKRPLSANSVQHEGGGGEGEAMIAGTEMHRGSYKGIISQRRVWTDRDHGHYGHQERISLSLPIFPISIPASFHTDEFRSS